MLEAQQTIFIVGWDIHSELRLVRDGENEDVTLRALLDSVAAARSDLDVYVLNWDFAMIYTLEREFFPSYKLRWKSHDRVHFCLDGEHPVGASQHQKIVVVDDCVAFAGGIDLSKWRWDTREHRPEDERRVDPSGESYPPFHDVQMMVDGDAAASLGEIVRERWRVASGTNASTSRGVERSDPWPKSVKPDLCDVRVGIARTMPSYEDRTEVREVERLFLDSIASAQRFIYMENQYLSSHRVGEALAERLCEPEGPEVVIVMPEKTGGWLEQHTMDVLRARLVRSLRDADEHGRLRLYYARLAKDPPVSLMVHAKVMIVDDVFARVGSANLSNRSMGFDAECDLAVESSERQDCGAAIQAFRRGLLAEHLGVDANDVARAESERDSLISAIEALRDGERTLEPLSTDVPQEVDDLVPESDVLDPEKPVDPEQLFDRLVVPGDEEPVYRRALTLGAVVLAAVGLAAAWRWTSLHEWVDVDSISALGRWVDEQPFTPALVLLGYVLGGLVVVPVTLLVLATVAVFGPWVGMAYALVGSVLSALASFGVGHMLGRGTVDRLAGSRVNRIRRTLSRRGLVATITIRIVPVAPFSVINFIAGVSDIRVRDFALGTFIGMIPGVAAVAFLTDRILASLRDPSMQTIAVLVGVAVTVVGSLFGLRRWLERRRANAAPDR